MEEKYHTSSAFKLQYTTPYKQPSNAGSAWNLSLFPATNRQVRSYFWVHTTIPLQSPFKRDRCPRTAPLTLNLFYEVSGQAHAPTFLPPSKEEPLYPLNKRQGGPRDGLDVLEKIKNYCLCRISNPQSSSPRPNSYTDVYSIKFSWIYIKTSKSVKSIVFLLRFKAARFVGFIYLF